MLDLPLIQDCPYTQTLTKFSNDLTKNGITSAVYAARKKMDFTVITTNIGGQVTLSSQIENYIGFQYITGLGHTRKKFKYYIFHRDKICIVNVF